MLRPFRIFFQFSLQKCLEKIVSGELVKKPLLNHEHIISQTGNSQENRIIGSFCHSFLDGGDPRKLPAFFVAHPYFNTTLVKVPNDPLWCKSVNHKSSVVLSHSLYIVCVLGWDLLDNTFVGNTIFVEYRINLFWSYLLSRKSFFGEHCSLPASEMC